MHSDYTPEQWYLYRVGNALRAAIQGPAGSSRAEELVAQLAGEGLIIVDVPPGIKHDFVGVPRT